MAEQKPVTRNAADPSQVKAAGKAERVIRAEQLADVRILMSTYGGRRGLWRFIEACHVFHSIMVTNSEIYARAGRHDFGLFLMAEIMEADPEGFLTMQREWMERKNINVEADTTKTGEDDDG